MPNPIVLYWNSIPSPYFVERIAEVKRTKNVEVKCIFDTLIAPSRDWLPPHPDDLAGDYVLDQNIEPRMQQVVNILRRERPNLLVSLYHSPSYAAGSMSAQALGIRTAFRVLPTFDSWNSRTRKKELSKQFLFRRVDSVKVSGREGAEYAMSYGVPMDRVFPVTQSIDVAHYATARSMPLEIRRQRRDELGLFGFTFMYVGRLTRLKGLDALFSAFDQVCCSGLPATLLVVGSGTDETEYRSRTSGNPRVRFLGFHQPSELPAIYALADSLVFPTLGDPNGLVVEEAMAAGLPIISSSSAGNIRDRLGYGAAGIIVPPGDSFALGVAMGELMQNPKLSYSMGRTGAKLVETRSHEHYAEDFVRFVEGTLRLPRVLSTQTATRYFGRMLSSTGRR